MAVIWTVDRHIVKVLGATMDFGFTKTVSRSGTLTTIEGLLKAQSDSLITTSGKPYKALWHVYTKNPLVYKLRFCPSSVTVPSNWWEVL